MRIAVDATSLLDVRTGIGVFTDALVSGLRDRDDVECTAFCVSVRGRARLADATPGLRSVAPPLPARLVRRWWQHLPYPRIDTFVGRHDVVHGPNFVVPPTRGAAVVTVHDLTPLRYPELCGPATLAYPALVQAAMDRGAWVHTDSAAVAAEVREAFDVDPERVVPIPLGHRSMAGGDGARGRDLAGGDDFVMAVGTVEPRKDLPGLVDALDLASEAGHRIPLVHVGPDGWGAEAFAQRVATSATDVRRLGRVSDDDLRDLYAAARLVAYPSVYEGFGFPVLEAMSAGVPVVTTTDPAIAEIAGDAALLAPVRDTEALAQALVRGWEDEALRSQLIERGAERVERYRWDRCVDGLVDLYRRADDGGS